MLFPGINIGSFIVYIPQLFQRNSAAVSFSKFRKKNYFHQFLLKTVLTHKTGCGVVIWVFVTLHVGVPRCWRVCTYMCPGKNISQDTKWKKEVPWNAHFFWLRSQSGFMVPDFVHSGHELFDSFLLEFCQLRILLLSILDILLRQTLRWVEPLLRHLTCVWCWFQDLSVQRPFLLFTLNYFARTCFISWWPLQIKCFRNEGFYEIYFLCSK